MRWASSAGWQALHEAAPVGSASAPRIALKRVSILVDAQNVYYTTRQAYGCGFDYNAFWARATAERQLHRATAYSSDKGDARQGQFQNILRAIGFEVKLKPYLQRADGSAKCDWDVGITLDALELAKESDVIVLVSGDGDFDLLLHKLEQDHALETEVYGVPGLTSQALIRAASHYVPIEGPLLLRK